MKKLTSLLATAVAFAGVNAQAQDSSILSSASFEIGWTSQYVWRGTPLAGATFEPGVNVGLFDDRLTLGFAAYLPQDTAVKPGRPAGYNQYNKYNYIASYNTSLGVFDLSLGGIAYVFRTSDNTLAEGEIYEAFLSLGYLWEINNNHALNLGVTFASEVHVSGGGSKTSFVEGSAEYAMQLGRATVSALGFLGYFDRGDYLYGGVTASVTYPLDASGRLNATGSVTRTEPIDNSRNRDIDNLIFRLGVSLSL